ncbi:MAG TPA: S9 family peptidase [Pyrinomonadaceae bacterium]|nr:S9 family peptidase [Pyrinomonadaceae bacterium]
MQYRNALSAAVFVLLVLAQVARAQDRLLTIDDIYDPDRKVNFDGTPPASVRWLKDGAHFLQFRPAEGASAPGQLLKVNARTGEATPFHDAARMERALAGLAGVTAEDARRLARRTSYDFNPDETAALVNHSNDLFFYSFADGRAARLTNNRDEESVEEFSPDGRSVSFIRNNNLYVVDLANGQERALTTDGGPKIFNGKLDWVYQEEIYGRGNFKGYWWSPDSSRITYLRLDESPVHEFTVVDHIPTRQELEVTPYPKAGDPNPKVQIGVVSPAGGATRWLDTSKYQSADHLIVRVGWTPDSRQVAYQVQDREQTWLELNFAPAAEGRPAVVLREQSKAWVEPTDESVTWLKDGTFLWLSDRTGHRHVYHYAADGKLIRPLTAGNWDVRSLSGVDEAGGFVYFLSSAHSATADHPYRVKLDGSGLTRLSTAEGSHRVSFNPPATLFVDFWSDVNMPTQVRLHSADGSVVRAIDENRVDALRQYKLGKAEFLQVKTRDGFTMEAMMIRPPDFDPTKKYPVMSFTYGGPQAPQVRNRWGSSTYLWHQLLAQKGYIIWVVDNRSASHKGVETAWPVYQNLGELELRDLEDGLAWLKGQPYVDGSRVGIWGWSYGGYMTAYALTHSKSFRIGIAGAPVTDWSLYDTVYTERYMKTPQNNPEGYRRSSVLAAAKDLSGKLLLIHGTVDDNVHLQNSVKFIYELQRAGKQFQFMVYPKSRHGVSDRYLIKHMRTMMTDFITQNL